MNEIFSGNNSANPMEICEALWRAGDLTQEDIVGAVMSLCRTVAAQNARIDSLCEEILRFRDQWHGMTVAAKQDFLSQALNEGDGVYRP